MEVKKGRLAKGSPEAKQHMEMLRSKRKGKTGGGSPAAPSCDCPPKQEEIIIEPPTAPVKKQSRKKIIVDFS